MLRSWGEAPASNAPRTNDTRSALFEQRDRRHDLPGCAVAALKTVVANERLLHRVAGPLGRQALDGHHIAPFTLSRQGQAGQHPPAVDQHGAGAAGALVAALL